MGMALTVSRSAVTNVVSRWVDNISNRLNRLRRRREREQEEDEFPLVEIPKKRKHFNLRIWAKFFYFKSGEPVVKKILLFSRNTVETEPNSTKNFEECIRHINIYEGKEDKTMDVTILKGMKEQDPSMTQFFLFWENLNTRQIQQINFMVNSNNPLPCRQILLQSVHRVEIWGENFCIDNEDSKWVKFSKSLLPAGARYNEKDPVDCTFHVTEYNKQLDKTLDVVTFKGTKLDSVSEEFLHCINLKTKDVWRADFPLKLHQIKTSTLDFLNSALIWLGFFINFINF